MSVSQWESAEVAIAAALSGIAGASFYTAAQLKDVWPPTAPGTAILIECYDESQYQPTVFSAGLSLEHPAIQFRVVIATRSGSTVPGGSRLGNSGTYAFADAVKVALFSTPISLPASGAFVSDCKRQTGGMIQEGCYAIEQQWELKTTFPVCYIV